MIAVKRALPIGAPKRLDSISILGSPTYDDAKMVTMGLITEF